MNLFRDDNRLLLKDSPGNYDFTLDSNRRDRVAKERKKREAAYNAFKNFVKNYTNTAQTKVCPGPSLLRGTIAELGEKNQHLKKGQHDCAEILNVFGDCFNKNEYFLKVSIKTSPDIPAEENENSENPEPNSSEYTEIDETHRCIQKDEELFILPLPMGSATNFQECWDAYFKEETINDCKFIYHGKLYNRDAKKETKISLPLPTKGLLISYNRFDSIMKIKSKIKLEELKANLGGSDFLLKGFVVHHGNSKNSGHYIACCYCKKEEKWYEFDDAVCSLLTEPDVKDKVQDAYVLFFEPSISS